MNESLAMYLRVKAGQSRTRKVSQPRRKLCKDCKRELLVAQEKKDKRCSFCQADWEESLEEEIKREEEMPD